MGVLEAVRGWDAYHGVDPEPVVNQAGIDPLATEAEILEAQANLYTAEDASEPVVSEEVEAPEAPKEDEWTTAKLDELTKADHVALLLEHARHMAGPGDHKGESSNLRRSCCTSSWSNSLMTFTSTHFRGLYPTLSNPSVHELQEQLPFLARFSAYYPFLLPFRLHFRGHHQRS